MSNWQDWVAVLGAVLALMLVRGGLRAILRPRRVRVDLRRSGSAGATTLVAVVHGVSGRGSVEGLVGLIQSTLPQADCLVLDYDSRPFSNTDPFDVANVLEERLHEEFSAGGYRSVILVGHSAGGAILRKAFVWARGQEEDRYQLGARGTRPWAQAVQRIVMLAGINRGWSVETRQARMGWLKFAALRTGLPVARSLGIAEFTRGVYRGTPFIANTRVQWLRLSRSDAVVDGTAPFPQVIQLLGDADDLVSREDGMDLVASRGTVFKTLSQTTHADITQVLQDPSHPQAAERAAVIRRAIVGDVGGLQPDLPPAGQLAEDRTVRRIVYLMHGIRDHGDWTDVIRRAIDRRIADSGEKARVTNLKYGYFAMLPFLLYRDRQRNVRRFMDEVTENLAEFPNATTLDYLGHSNGTYVLASALQGYATLRVRRVFFAGSVVPKHYPWSELVQAGRVEQVVNVVATSDWVVALFPKLFEQIADWLGARPRRGWLDIGAAGFRGFLDAGEASGAVVDMKYVAGKHSAGVDVTSKAKLDAIVAYIFDDDRSKLQAVFCERDRPAAVLDLLSNICYTVWFALAILAVALGWLASLSGVPALAAYLLVLYLVLNSV